MAGFTGIHIAKTGMAAQQKALEVTAHNIANANTKGYSRQMAKMATTAPMPFVEGKGSLGSGVKVAEITRVRDDFLSMQIRKEMNTLGAWDNRSQVLEQIEMVFNEPAETGLNEVLSRFFDSWQDVSLHPESSPVRAVLMENADALTQSVRHIHQQLKTVRRDIDDQVVLKVMEMNSAAEQIKDLNTQITQAASVGSTPADLLDRRDLLVDTMSQIADVTIQASQSGAINMYLGGRTLVQEGTAYQLKTASHQGGGGADWPAAPSIVWERDGREVAVRGGEIGGLLEVRDVNVKTYMEDFSSLVWGLSQAVNDLHEQGMDLEGELGQSFFVGDHLENWTVNADIKDSLYKVAAASYDAEKPNPGDGSWAVKIAQLRQQPMVLHKEAPVSKRLTMPGEEQVATTTLENFYRDSVARLGVDSQESQRMTENQTTLLEMMKARQDAISGVSIDEELAHMVQFQMAYQANARLITTFDDLLDTVVNRMLR